MDASSMVGKSGNIAVHLVPTDTGDPRFVLEHIQLGELIDLPDLATAREVHALLGHAIMKAQIRMILDARSLDNGRDV